MGIYDAVRLLAAAVRIAGPNRAGVRDYLASGATCSGLGGPVSFDKAGNSQSEYVLQGPADPSIQANSPRSRRAPPRDAQTLY
jgi:hypothetical protein